MLCLGTYSVGPRDPVLRAKAVGQGIEDAQCFAGGGDRNPKLRAGGVKNYAAIFLS